MGDFSGFLSPQISAMEEDISSPTEVSRIVDLDKKRKFQGELLMGIPLPNHVCCDTVLEMTYSSDLSSDPKRLRSSTNSSAYEPAHISSGASNADSVSSPHDTEASASSSASVGVYSEFNSYSSEATALTPEESSSVHDEHSTDGSKYLDTREDYQQGFEQYSESTSSGYYQDDNVELFGNDDLVSPIGIRTTHFTQPVLENQDAEQGPDKPTIDKEFEQYFSQLLL